MHTGSDPAMLPKISFLGHESKIRSDIQTTLNSHPMNIQKNPQSPTIHPTYTAAKGLGSQSGPRLGLCRYLKTMGTLKSALSSCVLPKGRCLQASHASTARRTQILDLLVQHTWPRALGRLVAPPALSCREGLPKKQEQIQQLDFRNQDSPSWVSCKSLPWPRVQRCW